MQGWESECGGVVQGWQSERGGVGWTPSIENEKHLSSVQVLLIELKNQDVHPIFLEILIPYSRFSSIYKTDLNDFQARVFPIFQFLRS